MKLGDELLAALGVVDAPNVAKPTGFRIEANPMLRANDVYSVWIEYDGMSGYVGAFDEREVAQQIGELRYRLTLQHYVLAQLLARLGEVPV